MDAYLPERLALTGATGALGFAFLRHHFERDPKLRASLLVRSSSDSFQAEAFQVWLRQNESRLTLIEGDMRQLGPKQVDDLLGCDGGLWHFAALTSLTAECDETAQEIHEINAEGTRRLAEAFLGGKARGPFFHVSTAYVVGQRHGVAQESESQMGQTFRNPYEASKLAAETHVQRTFASGVAGAIFRPSVVVDGSGRTGGFKMVDACAYGVALAVKRGEPFVFRMPSTASINLIHSDWVIAAMSDLARLPSGSGLTYHLSAPRSTYFRDIATILEKYAPGLKVSFAPDLKRSELPTASKLFDKAVKEIQPYFLADVHFDRTNTERDLSPAMKELPLDLTSFVESRLQADLDRMGFHKQVS